MRPKITVRQRQRLKRAINMRIREYVRCQKQLHHVDQEVFAAGMELFGSESTLARWLCEPDRALNGKAPLLVRSTAKDRMRVANTLRVSI